MDFPRQGRVTGRHVSRVASLLVLLVLGLACPGGAALAQPAALSLNPAQGPPGTNVVATASGFTPGDTLTLIWSGNGAFLTNAMADANGNATIQITIPNSGNGQSQVQVQSRFGQTASATFTITAAQPAALALSPAQGPVGTSVTATASGFAPGDMLSLFVFPMTEPVATATADASGGARIPFAVPSVEAGGHDVSVQGRSGQRRARPSPSPRRVRPRPRPPPPRRWRRARRRPRAAPPPAPRRP
jgi:hypothetical protein